MSGHRADEIALADPAAVRTAEGWYVYGTAGRSADGLELGMSFSSDLEHWSDVVGVLQPLHGLGDAYWAPEVCERDGAWWMYYSVGHGHAGHSLRVARAEGPAGPFVDLGVDLTPLELFAIDASPYQHTDGSWWLLFARDVLEHDRPGTHLAVAELPTPTTLGTVRPLLAPYADWQIYERDRPMYGRRWDWHTLEGPHAVERDGVLLLTFSGGSFQGPGYRVAWAHSKHPAGPWVRAPEGADVLLATDGELIGPGHNSVTTDAEGRDVIVFHSWDRQRTARRLRLRGLHIDASAPSIAVGHESDASLG
ncbi:glycoside hydrolase family 43 protein [Pseudactinotalea sp.]|uniref:glycoside hydrolase family 43 protein n=1 Tax=Pseudactinotalea sp. TaxID=1926260 RepID=UPI003B3AEC6F